MVGEGRFLTHILLYRFRNVWKKISFVEVEHTHSPSSVINHASNRNLNNSVRKRVQPINLSLCVRTRDEILFQSAKVTFLQVTIYKLVLQVS